MISPVSRHRASLLFSHAILASPAFWELALENPRWTIRNRLVLVALAVALPLLLLSAGVVWSLVDHERENRREAVMFSTRALLSTLDAMLAKQIGLAQTLSSSPALLAGDFVEFRTEAERAWPTLSGAWIIVADQSGQQLFNLTRQPGETLPQRNPAGLKAQQQALATGKVHISDVIISPTSQQPIVTVEVPVLREGRPPLALAVIMETRLFLPLFDGRYLPEGWMGGLLDRNGHFIARSKDHERYVGQPASETFLAAARGKEGWVAFVAVDGKEVLSGHVTSELSGWVMGLAAERAAFEQPIQRTVVFALLAAGVATFLALVLAILAARKIADPIAQIEHGTQALLRREVITYPKTGVAEVDRALEAFTTTATALAQHEKERDENEAHVRLIMRELSHRSKNLLAIVLAIARQTARQTSNFQEFETRFNARIQSLADAHDLLVEQQWVGASLEDLVRGQLHPFGTERIAIKGEPIMLRAEAVQNIGLALHELATNASKYGALSVPEGRVRIDWALDGKDPDARSLRMTWQEQDGPPVTEPTRKGFGRFVLERATLSALGTGALEFRPSGLVWTCEIEPQHLVARGAKSANAPRTAPKAAERRAS